MKENFIIVCVVLLFLSFLGLLVFGAYINKNQIDLQLVVKKIGEKIIGYDEEIKDMKQKVDENKKIVSENSKKLEDINSSYNKDIKILKGNVQNNAELIKKEKNEINQNYKKLSNMLKNTQNVVQRLDNSVDIMFKNQKIYATYKSKFDTVNSNIESIIKRVEKLESLDRTQTDMSEFVKNTDQKFNDLDGKIVSLNNGYISRISDIENRNIAIEEEYNKLKEQVASLQEKLEKAKAEAPVIPVTNNDQTNDQKIANLKNNLDSFQNDINTQIGSIKTTIEEINKKISDLETRYNEAEKNGFKPK
ncbi:MAG TPA: hypothetical protein PK771_02520 [Spirochaetota bacterium]|nr:hypothetical protein [Spirochaetota bacterium]